LLRLRDGGIALFFNACQNWSDPRSYAMGGREVLHAAISRDEGRTWRGFREVLHDTDATARGDRGSAYPSAAETRGGKVVFASGQGEGKRAIVMFDPRWLEESSQMDQLEYGAVAWTAFGGGGLRVESPAAGRPGVAIPLRAAKPGGALWNFPAADSGEVELRIRVPAGGSQLQLSLNDHFNRIDDVRAGDHAVFTMPVGQWLDGDPGREHALRLRWQTASSKGELSVELDGKPVGRGTTKAQRPAQFGVNYLRVEFPAANEEGAVVVSELSVRSR
jgi:hypothetical protein